MPSQTSKQKLLHGLSSKLISFLESMKEMGVRRNIPNISWNTADFLRETLQPLHISEILEIGPANGFSTMMLALAQPESHITSIEISRHAFEELRHNLSIFTDLLHGVPPQDDGPADFPPKVTSSIDQIEVGHFSLYYADAREVLPAFLLGKSEVLCQNPASHLVKVPEKRFDCIFIDGAFRMTRDFFDLSRPLLQPGGIIILDDAIKYRWKMDGFHEYLEESGITYELVQTDADDGVMVISLS